MSRARECYGASGLSFLLASWTLDLKMLAPFYLWAATGGGHSEENYRTSLFNGFYLWMCWQHYDDADGSYATLKSHDQD